MSGHLPRTNRWLILLSIVLCLIFGGIFTRSSAGPSQVSADSDAGVFVSEDQCLSCGNTVSGCCDHDLKSAVFFYGQGIEGDFCADDDHRCV